MTGVLNTDGVTPMRVKANPTTHLLDVMDGATGTDMGNGAVRDDNGVPVSIVVSSSDGIDPVTLYVDSSGNLLVQSS